jgi:preprotein translocase SecE subunit
VAKEFEKITVSDESDELETETDGADSSGIPPAKVASGTHPGSSGDGGGRRPAKAAASHGFSARTGQFLHDTRAEMRRVSWPSATVVKNTTIITLIAVVFFSLYLFAVDRVWAFLIERLRSLLGG